MDDTNGHLFIVDISKRWLRHMKWYPIDRFKTLQNDSKVHGANMGPIWGRQDPGGPHVVPWSLLSRLLSLKSQSTEDFTSVYFTHLSMYKKYHSVYALSQWEMALHCNAVSHWSGAYTEWYLYKQDISHGVSKRSVEISQKISCLYIDK